MSRKSVKLTVEDLNGLIRYVENENHIPDWEELLKKWQAWAKGEIKRREKSGKLGGRPKKKKPEIRKIETVESELYGFTDKGLVIEDASMEPHPFRRGNETPVGFIVTN